jgi:hypothetical protein
MNSVPEIRRERVIIPPDMTTSEIKEKYGLSSKQAGDALKSGFFVRNYSRKQVIIDRDNFDPSVSYSTAKRVYNKNFSMNPVAESIKEDLIQEAVTRMYELSGKVKENANGKYSMGYGFFWVAHNAMLSYLKTWQRQMRWCISGDIEDGQMARRIYASRNEVLWSE